MKPHFPQRNMLGNDMYEVVIAVIEEVVVTWKVDERVRVKLKLN